jgi:DHA1 family bicyclomycin/chloramphenicol resistance-like MFS transporter
MLAQIAGAFLSRRLVVHRGIARMLRVGTLAALAGSLPMTGLALWGAGHWLSVAAPIALVLFSASILMPNTTAAAMTPFARHAGAAASLLGFLQSATNVLVSGALAALYDGSARPLALTVALGALVSAASLPWALRVLARKDA